MELLMDLRRKGLGALEGISVIVPPFAERNIKTDLRRCLFGNENGLTSAVSGTRRYFQPATSASAHPWLRALLQADFDGRPLRVIHDDFGISAACPVRG
jgi:hypothetical protein